METLNSRRPHWFNTLVAARLAAGLALAVFMIVYWYQPLPGSWNDHLYYAPILLCAWMAAILGTLVWRQYGLAEPPRRVWGFFALGLWSWALGEAVWLLLRPFYESFPDVFITDLFWLAAYFFFAGSIFLQYRLIMRPEPHQERRLLLLAAIGAPAAVILLTLGLRLAGLGGEWSLPGMLIYACYPIGDVLVGFSGLYLSRLFGRGRWGRAWWGVVAFALSDGISFWYNMGGEVLISSARLAATVDSVLSLLVDTLYFSAYILLALACLGQLQLLKKPGPLVSPGQEEPYKDAGLGVSL